MTRGFTDDDAPRDDDAQVVIPDVTCVRVTDRAILVRFNARDKHDEHGCREHWVPQSVITDDSEVWELGQTGTLVVRAWFAKREGLDDDD